MTTVQDFQDDESESQATKAEPFSRCRERSCWDVLSGAGAGYFPGLGVAVGTNQIFPGGKDLEPGPEQPEQDHFPRGKGRS